MKTALLIMWGRSMIRFALILTCTIQAESLYGQTIYTAIHSQIVVTGKSNVRTWELTSQKAKCSAEFNFSGSKLNSIKSISFSVAVKDLKGHTPLMEKRAYKALKAYPYGNITYTGKLIKISGFENKKQLIRTEGNMRIAGTTRILSIPVTASIQEDGTITCTGSTSIRMSDFKVRLPQVLIESMEIGNTVNVDFKFVFDRSEI